MLRTHTCGELKVNDINKEVTLCGWVARRRDHGKLIFIDIRDRWGFTQVVFIPKESGDAYQAAQDLRSEFVIKLKGAVKKRPQGTLNPKLNTGEIEVLAKELEILNPSINPPFEITDDIEISEETRLKYRYLDLRRDKVFKNLLLRSDLYKIMRRYLDAHDFIECETPILTKSTPEGARDYLVPSRLNPGLFYALPQSPQLFKQILMVAGIERYYQVAKCFRDEDLRADRQPEFTQLDLEMSFVNEEDVFSVIEELMRLIFKGLKGIELNLPFRRISFSEAQTRYNTDKPDLRKDLNNEFAFVWVVDFPLFKYNAEEKRWESEHHPFTAPKEEDLERLEREPDKVKSRSYDLVLNGVELGSGSIRIHRQLLQERIFKIIGIDKDSARERFGFLLEAFQFGAPPHGGFAFGVDRLLSILSGEPSIREVIAFPKTSAGVCPLTSAPSNVDEKQLNELNLILKKGRGAEMKKNLLYFLTLALILVLSGCVARTYPLTRDRLDQDLETGNRGYLMGKAPLDTVSDRKETRTVRVFEIELGKPYKSKKINTADNSAARDGAVSSETSINENFADTSAAGLTAADVSAKQYTVGKNDTLQKISQKFYGTTKKWTKIYAANRDVLKGPDKVYPGQVLVIPGVSETTVKQQTLTETEANLK